MELRQVILAERLPQDHMMNATANPLVTTTASALPFLPLARSARSGGERQSCTTHRRLRRNGRATSASCTQVELPILPGGTSACGCSLMTLALSGSGLPQAEAARLSSSNRKTVADQVKTGATGLFPREEMTVYVDGTQVNLAENRSSRSVHILHVCTPLPVPTSTT